MTADRPSPIDQIRALRAQGVPLPEAKRMIHAQLSPEEQANIEAFWDELEAAAECKCARIKVGSQVTESRNWNPDCPEHGVQSEWWNSPEQVAKREKDSIRLRDLQLQAARKRQERKHG